MHLRLKKAPLSLLVFITSIFASESSDATVINGLVAYSCRSQDSHQNICLINPNGTGKQQITSGGDNGLPNWSPDGKKIAYTRYDVDPKTGASVSRIFVMNVADRSTRFITSGIAPAWSPDGTQIAFSKPSSTSPSTSEIWTVRPDGTNQRQLTNSPGSDKTLPTWAPDGRAIAYTLSVPDPGRPSGIHNTVAVTTLGDSKFFELTAGFICAGPSLCFQNLDAAGNVIANQPVLDAGSPSWSPVSSAVVFWSGLEGGTGEIWKIDASGKNRKQLTLPPKPPFGLPYPNSDDPTWSPDGTKILFSSNRTVKNIPFAPFHVQIPEIWVMDGDGKNPHALVETSFGPLPGRAAWQPVPSSQTASLALFAALTPEPESLALLAISVPEPDSMVLLGGALLGYGLIRRRHRVQSD